MSAGTKLFIHEKCARAFRMFLSLISLQRKEIEQAMTRSKPVAARNFFSRLKTGGRIRPQPFRKSAITSPGIDSQSAILIFDFQPVVEDFKSPVRAPAAAGRAGLDLSTDYSFHIILQARI